MTCEEQMKNKGFTLIELMVAVAIVAIIAAIAIPAIQRGDTATGAVLVSTNVTGQQIWRVPYANLAAFQAAHTQWKTAMLTMNLIDGQQEYLIVIDPIGAEKR